MYGGKTLENLNNQAVVQEYVRAVRDENTTKAKKIRTANPDLHKDFDQVDREHLM